MNTRCPHHVVATAPQRSADAPAPQGRHCVPAPLTGSNAVPCRDTEA
jgi:hypothetical protein